MLKPGERVKLIPRDRTHWHEMSGEVLTDDGSDIRLRYSNGDVCVVPWETIAVARVREVAE